VLLGLGACIIGSVDCLLGHIDKRGKALTHDGGAFLMREMAACY